MKHRPESSSPTDMKTRGNKSNILRRFRSRRFLMIGLLVVIACIALSVGDIGRAGGGDILNEDIKIEYDQSALEEFAYVAERGIKIIMLLMWPLLTIAGAAMDNSLVYGGAFHLTTALRQFRNIIRTFTNFLLGFIFIGSILAAFFGYNRDKGATWIRDLLKNVLIAGILIHMSRWALAAVIDISTVSTVAIGGMPLSFLRDKSEKNKDPTRKENIFYMKPYVRMNNAPAQDANQDKYSYSVVYGCTYEGYTRHYLPCPIENNALLPKQGDETKPLTRENYKKNTVDARSKENNVKVTKESIDDYYCVHSNLLIEYKPGVNVAVRENLNELIKEGIVEGKDKCAKVDELITKASGMTGPLFTLFGSLLGVADVPAVANYGSFAAVTLEALIKMAFGLALLVPLFAFAVVMIIRVVIIRVLIVFAPILILAFVFGFGEKLKGIHAGMSVPSIISLIFLPTFAVFGVSISIIFLSLLVNVPKLDLGDKTVKDAFSAMGMDISSKEPSTCYDLKMTTICITESTRKTGGDIINIMNRLVINSFGIAMMRMIVFFTLKSNDFTKGVAEGIENVAKDRMKTLPIIPIGGGVGLGALDQLKSKASGLARQKIDEQYRGFGLEDSARSRAMNNDPETKKIQEKFTDAKGNVDKSKQVVADHPIDAPNIPVHTDMNDYQSAPATYATDWQAKNPTNWAGANIENINSWQSAFKRSHFVKQMITDKKYNTNFFDSRNRDPSKKSANAKMMEEGLGSLVALDGDIHGTFTDTKDGIKYNRYLYHNHLIKYGRKGNQLDKLETTKFSKDETALDKITSEDVTSLSRLRDKVQRAGVPDVTLKKTFKDGVIAADPGQKLERKAKIQDGDVIVTFDDNAGTNITKIVLSKNTTPNNPPQPPK